MTRPFAMPSMPRAVTLAALASILTFLALGAGTARAAVGIESFTTSTSSSQAGGHPNLETTFTLEHSGEPEAPKTVTFNAPEGVFGNTNAASQCTPVALTLDQCPSAAQVGLATIYANYNSEPEDLLGTAPIYSMVPRPEETARFVVIVPTINIPISIPVTVRTGSDYGLSFSVSDIPQFAPLASVKLTFWGFPGAESHNSQRFPKGEVGEPAGCPGSADTSCTLGTTASIPNRPLIDNPTTCTGGPLVTSLEVVSYQDPSHVSGATSSYPPIEECENETFNPVLQASPTTTETDAPSGLNLELNAPQSQGLAASPSEIRSVVVTMPPGFTINPDAADGQSECLDSQANFGSRGPAECPDNAKIGTSSISAAGLTEPLSGSVYIGEPKPGDQYRVFLIAAGSGMNVKLVGSLKPDPITGQLTAYFENLPQVPFESFRMHLFAGERALMATPTACTIYSISGDFFPWNASRADQVSSQSFGLASGPHGSSCPGQTRPFAPTLEAGTSTPRAGAYSSFALKLNREDGDQYLGKLNFVMPPGLTANLHGVTYCPEAAILAAAQTSGREQLANPSCPASSEIGTSNVAAGPGLHPFHAVGKIYFAGPFQGAPFSLAVITPALAGPYDYGTVVVRVALHIDPHDAHVIADSETVPSIIGGIPLRLREIRVSIDKPNFMLNPTNCSPFAVGSEGVGDQGTAVAFSSYFHAVNCSTLPFRPKMTVTQLGGHRQTRRSQDPSMRFELTTRPGDANVKSVEVTLPTAFAIDQRHLGNLCSKAELASDHCAGRAAIGTVKDVTPLLEAPLEGPAFAVSGYGKLPHLAFILGGQVTVIPEAESSSVKGGHLKTVVPTVPDVPIGRFALTLYGGKKGYITNTRSLCTSPVTSTIEYTAQNGRKLTQHVRAATACGAGSKKSKHHTRK